MSKAGSMYVRTYVDTLRPAKACNSSPLDLVLENYLVLSVSPVLVRKDTLCCYIIKPVFTQIQTHLTPSNLLIVCTYSRDVNNISNS